MKPMNPSAMPIKFSVAALLAALALAPSAHATEKTEPTAASPWGFNLTLYAWLAGVKGNLSAGPFSRGNFSVGPFSRSVDANFIDIVNQTRRFPLGFMGRFEAHYERFGFFVDGTYMDIQLKPRFENLSNGVDSDLGLMDYGLMYRIFGPTADEIPGWQGKKRPNRLDVYAGARTIWLENSVTLTGPRGLVQREFSASDSFTSPLIGGRFVVDFTPEIFMLVDGNIGGFGAQNVSFTGGVMGLVGYRMTAFDVPLSIQAGYKALRYELDQAPLQTKATLNGPFLGLTGYW